MKTRIFCEVLCLFTVISLFSCSSDSGPETNALQENFANSLPEFLTVQNFEIKTTEIGGDEANPEYRSRFHAQLRLICDTHKIDDRDQNTVIVQKVATQGDIVNVIGTTESKRNNNAWQITAEMLGSPIDSLGVPLDSLANAASRIIMDGTDEAFAYRSEKAKRLMAEKKARRAAEPDYVTVQHILIGFQGSIDGADITRTKEEARVLAEALLLRAKEGEDFDLLVETYSDDRAPGIYEIANTGVAPNLMEHQSRRSKMVRAFGDVSFSLKAGEIGMAAYHPINSPYGWHIIKRIEHPDNHTNNQH